MTEIQPAGTGPAWDDASLAGVDGAHAAGNASGGAAPDPLDLGADPPDLLARPRSTGFNASLLQASLTAPEADGIEATDEADAEITVTIAPRTVDELKAHLDGIQREWTPAAQAAFDEFVNVYPDSAKYDDFFDLSGGEWLAVMEKLGETPWKGDKTQRDRIFKGMTNNHDLHRFLDRANEKLGLGYPSRAEIRRTTYPDRVDRKFRKNFKPLRQLWDIPRSKAASGFADNVRNFFAGGLGGWGGP